jgi:hypothetical protein
LRVAALREMIERMNHRVDFPKPGWWAVHMAGIATAYTLGHLLWR